MKTIYYIPVITKRESYKLPVDEIIYIYRSNRKLMFVTDSGLMHSYDKIDVIEQFLGPDFFRCMSGCIVNLARIVSVKDSVVKFDDGTVYTPGKAAYPKIKDKYNAHMVRTLLDRKKQEEKEQDYDDQNKDE